MMPAHCLSAGPSGSARGCWTQDRAGAATERAEERQTPPAGTTASPPGAWGGPPVSSRAYPPAAHGHPAPHSPPSTGSGTPTPCQAPRGRAPGASGNRRSDALTEAAAAQGLNQSGSRTMNLGRGRDVSPEIHGLEGGPGAHSDESHKGPQGPAAA